MTMTGNSEQNPFQQFISTYEDDKSKIQQGYETHRTTRNAQYKAKLLDADFSGWQIDEILKKLHSQEKDVKGSLFVDPRNNLAFWARPPQHIRELADEIQREIRKVAPSLWFTPPDCLHTTALEIANSQTPLEISDIQAQMEQTGLIPNMVNYTLQNRARLIKPMLSYDASAMALSFVPAAGEATDQTRKLGDDSYTYHHLRRDLFDQVIKAGAPIKARYTVPSAHITLARFITHDGFLLDSPDSDGSHVDRKCVSGLIETIEKINQNLKDKYWPKPDGHMVSKGEWVIGHEKGLEFCKGPSWYGESDRILLGDGFN